MVATKTETEQRQVPPAPAAPIRTIRGAAVLLWAFGRPHTLVGTSASVLALWVIAGDLPGGALWRDPGFGYALHGLLALVAALAANLYIVGLNQLTDVPIDRINKPDLPIASGALDLARARWIVAVSAASGLLLAALAGPVLLITVAIAMAIGTLYSAPPLRLKRWPVLAALSIATVRGIVVNAGISLHAAWLLGAPLVLTDRVQLLIAFVFTYSLAIAVAKDVPDTGGDRRYAIPTFAITLGRGSAIRLSGLLLLLSLLGLIAAGLTGVEGVNSAVLALTNAPIAVALLRSIRQVDPADTRSVQRFYRLVWWVFSAEYALYPIACLLG